MTRYAFLVSSCYVRKKRQLWNQGPGSCNLEFRGIDVTVVGSGDRQGQKVSICWDTSIFPSFLSLLRYPDIANTLSSVVSYASKRIGVSLAKKNIARTTIRTSVLRRNKPFWLSSICNIVESNGNYITRGQLGTGIPLTPCKLKASAASITFLLHRSLAFVRHGSGKTPCANSSAQGVFVGTIIPDIRYLIVPRYGCKQTKIIRMTNAVLLNNLAYGFPLIFSPMICTMCYYNMSLANLAFYRFFLLALSHNYHILRWIKRCAIWQSNHHMSDDAGYRHSLSRCHTL